MESTVTRIQPFASLTLPQTGYKILDADLGTTFYITLEPGNRTKQEIVSCTTVVQNANGTATLSGCSRGLLPITPYTASSTYAFAHGGGTSVIFSNPPQFYNQFLAADNSGTITGQYTFSTSPIIPTVASASTTNAASVQYVNNVAIQGAASSSNTIAGVTKLSVAPADANIPIAVGDNDNRVSPVSLATVTSGIVSAFAGSFGTPASTNKYLTELDATSTVASSSRLVRYTSTGQITATTTPVATTDATSKAYVDGQTYLSFKMGTTTRDLGAASSVMTIPHGLGRTPHKLTVKVQFGISLTNGVAVPIYQSEGFYDGTKMIRFSSSFMSSNGQAVGNGWSTTDIASMTYVGTGSGSTNQTATSTMDATNIYLGWTKDAGSTGGAMNIMWEVE